MILTLLKSKIHRAIVTDANLQYMGSITIDKELMASSGIVEHEKVHIVDIQNGNRFETYVIEGAAGSGVICLNGAAARLVQPGDEVIIMAYCQVTSEESQNHSPKITFVDSNNRFLREELGTHKK
ncbi:MAG: aspartate 1-decarboxylase [Caldisericia bacterium]|nr:aspartate 1-decarboxylase [Caldisericia bacterium]MDD4614487.1 aspartate 1-decarboxylase [Caldisericia bacterium]